jgi:hypothetical protein
LKLINLQIIQKDQQQPAHDVIKAKKDKVTNEEKLTRAQRAGIGH